MKKAIRRVLLGAAIALAAATATAQAPADRTDVPGLWTLDDLRHEAGRYGVLVATFPSDALAEGLRTTMVNLGWKPVRVIGTATGAQVVLGDFPYVGDAEFVALELGAQKLAVASVTTLPPGIERSTEPVSGPFLPAFLPTPGIGKPLSPEEVRAKLQGLERDAAADETDWWKTQVGAIASDSDTGLKGDAAAAIARRLAEGYREPDLVLFLAGKVARGEWKSSTDNTVACSALVADLLYGYRRDWRGAWRASKTLSEMPTRDANGKSLDRLRLAALLVELRASGTQPAPTWNRIRSELRAALDLCPPGELRTRCRIELVYMQTFAWEGDWHRVEELATDLIRRYPRVRGETSLARVFLARSLERERNYAEAISQLNRVTQTDLDEGELLRMGFEPADLRAEANRWLERFRTLESGGEPTAVAPVPITPTS